MANLSTPKLLGRAAALAAVASLGFGLAGCDETSRTSGNIASATPKGNVTGVVLDTNGNAITGATVRVANTTGSTDATGVFYLENVPVTNVVGADREISQSIPVSVISPAGFASATASVNPQAQIDSENCNTDGGADVCSVTNPNTVFFEGFVASAGEIVVPALTASAEFTVRSTQSGEALSGANVCWDFNRVEAGANGATANSDAVVVAGADFCTTTGADGKATVTGIAVDSRFNNLRVAGFSVDGVAGDGVVGGELSTNASEGLQFLVCDIDVTPKTSVDDVPPFVDFVEGGIVPQGSNRLFLNRNVDGTAANPFVIQFNETVLSTLGAGDVIVRLRNEDNTTGAVLASSFTVSGNTMTVTTDAAVPAATKIDILIARTQVTDTGANILVVDEDSTGATSALGSVGYDGYLGSFTHGTVTLDRLIELRLKTFVEINTDTGTVALSDCPAQAADARSLPTFSAAYADDSIEASQAGPFSQINADDAYLRLENLGNALLLRTDVEVNGGATVTIDITGGNPTALIVAANTPAGAPITLGTDVVATIISAGNATLTDDGTTLTVSPNGDSSVTLLLVDANNAAGVGSIQVSDIITVTPQNDIGDFGPSATLALNDCVRPTASLQRSYCLGSVSDVLGNNAAGNGVVPIINNQTVNAGNGNELFLSASDIQDGSLLSFLTPELLDDRDALNVRNTLDTDGVLNTELYNFVDVDAGTAGNQNLQTETFRDRRGIYDASAWMIFSMNPARTVAFDISEDISVGTPTYTVQAGDTSAVLTNWTAANNVQPEADATASDDPSDNPNSDLATVRVDNIFTFANADNAVVNFGGVLTDTAGNVSASDAGNRVVEQDRMPPFVVRAYNNSNSFVMEFNEPVQDNDSIFGANATDVTIPCGVGTISIDFARNATISTDGLTVTVPETSSGSITGVDVPSSCANLSQYSETKYGPANSAGTGTNVNELDNTNFNHGTLDFRFVTDANDGMSWDAWEALRVCSDDNGVNAPLFAYAQVAEIAAFTVSLGQNGFVNNATTFSVTLSATNVIGNFTQPFDFDRTPAPDGPVVLDDAIFPMFDINGAALGNANNANCTNENLSGTAFTCNAAFITSNFDFSFATGATIANTSTATFGADRRSLTLTINLTPGAASAAAPSGGVTTGDTANVSATRPATFDNDAQSAETGSRQTDAVPATRQVVANPS